MNSASTRGWKLGLVVMVKNVSAAGSPCEAMAGESAASPDYPPVMSNARINDFRVVLLASTLTLVSGCAGPRAASTSDSPRFDGWRAEATLAGRGGAGGTLAQWGFAPRADGTPDHGAPRVLAIPTPQDQTYNIFWHQEPRLANVELSLRVQARSGVVDQGGGPIWRVQDRDNYYICRINPLESNFRVYKVVGGVRTQLGSVTIESPAASADASGVWHTLTVRHVGETIVCAVDGATVLDVTDGAIAQPGGVGVWTKADAVTWFEKLIVTPATSPRTVK